MNWFQWFLLMIVSYSSYTLKVVTMLSRVVPASIALDWTYENADIVLDMALLKTSDGQLARDDPQQYTRCWRIGGSHSPFSWRIIGDQRLSYYCWLSFPSQVLGSVDWTIVNHDSYMNWVSVPTMIHIDSWDMVHGNQECLWVISYVHNLMMVKMTHVLSVMSYQIYNRIAD